MLIRPSSGLCAAKNIHDHAAFNASCAQKRPSAHRRSVDVFPSRKIRQRANAISRYNVVQTGPNTQLGGLNEGLTRLAYQGERLGYVASWPAADVAATAMIARRHYRAARHDPISILFNNVMATIASTKKTLDRRIQKQPVQRLRIEYMEVDSNSEDSFLARRFFMFASFGVYVGLSYGLLQRTAKPVPGLV